MGVERFRTTAGGVAGIAALAMLAALIPLWAPPSRAAEVDTAIVFAVDVSASIDPATADLQREGHAAAISAPEVIAAIARTPTGCIAVTYVEWSSRGQMRSVVPWTSICGSEDAQAVAFVIRKEGDRGYGCDSYCATSISFAIDLGDLLFDRYGGNASSKIIDISANGTNNDGLPVEVSRLRAIAKGCTINAIALPEVFRGVPRDLTQYFADNVIGGPNAFVTPLTTPNDYTVALRWKLVKEIGLSTQLSGKDMLAHR